MYPEPLAATPQSMTDPPFFFTYTEIPVSFLNSHQKVPFSVLKRIIVGLQLSDAEGYRRGIYEARLSPTMTTNKS